MEWIYLLSGLEKLDVSGNELNDELLVGLELLTNLKYFKASSQNIETMKVFTDCKNLKTLILDINQITDLSGLEELQNLEELNVNSNLIRKIDTLAKMPNLKRVYAKNNEITSFSPISHIIYEEEDFSENPGKR